MGKFDDKITNFGKTIDDVLDMKGTSLTDRQLEIALLYDIREILKTFNLELREKP